MPDPQRLVETIAALEREQERLAAQLATLRHLLVRLGGAQNQRARSPIT